MLSAIGRGLKLKFGGFMKRFKTTRYSVSIEAVEITKETDKTVFFKVRSGAIHSERKQTDYHQWFTTWDQAHNFLVRRTENQIHTIEDRLIGAKEDLAELLQMARPNGENGSSE